jgi:hypothetical protein
MLWMEDDVTTELSSLTLMVGAVTTVGTEFVGSEALGLPVWLRVRLLLIDIKIICTNISFVLVEAPAPVVLELFVCFDLVP